MANKVITAANVRFSSGVKSTQGISGEAISIMQPVYLDTSVSPNVFRLARANAAGTAGVYGVAMNSTPGANQTLDVAWYDPDLTPAFDAIAAGEIIAVSASASGANAPATDLASTNFVSLLGVGKAANKMVLDIVRSPDAKP